MGTSEIDNAACAMQQHSIDAAFKLASVRMSAIGQQPSSSQDHMRASFDGVATFVCKSPEAHLLEREEDFGGGLVTA
jgi:hypothetical protein